MAVHVETQGEYAQFHFPESHERTTDKLVALLEAYDAGRVKQRGLLRRLNVLAEQEPDHIDALAHLGMFLREANRPEEACAVCERALGIGMKALPKDFTGNWSGPGSRTDHSCGRRRILPSCAWTKATGVPASSSWSESSPGTRTTTRASG